jgi:hypothetical protein
MDLWPGSLVAVPPTPKYLVPIGVLPGAPDDVQNQLGNETAGVAMCPGIGGCAANQGGPALPFPAGVMLELLPFSGYRRSNNDVRSSGFGRGP